MPPKPVKVEALEKEGWKLNEAGRFQLIMNKIEAIIRAFFQRLADLFAGPTRAVESAANTVSSSNAASAQAVSAALKEAVAALDTMQNPNIQISPNIIIPDDEGAVWEFTVSRHNIYGTIKSVTARKVRKGG